jgi:RNA polymerase sigma-70 factor (ECF subfamily)
MNAKVVGSNERLLEHLTVLRCQAGDADAFARLHDGYQERVRRYLSRLVGSDAVEDVTQEVWVTVYRGIAGLTNPAAFRQWVFRIARSKAFDALRREKRRDALRFAVSRETATEEAELVMTEMSDQQVEEAMRHLSHEHQEVLQLRYFEDLPYAEIASIVGCSIGTIRSRLHHAKSALRAELTRPGTDPGGPEKEEIS